MGSDGWRAVRGASGVVALALGAVLVYLLTAGANGVGCAPSGFGSPGDCAFQVPFLVFLTSAALILSLGVWWVAARKAGRAG